MPGGVAALDGLAQAAAALGIEASEPLAELRKRVRAAIDVDGAPCTPAAILTTLAQPLGKQ